MSKRHLLVDTSSTVEKHKKLDDDPDTTDWALCIFCQEDTDEALQCPTKSTKAPIGGAYASVANHIKLFHEIGHLPFDISRLDDGSGLQSTLRNHNAVWHKSCRLKYNQMKLDRLRKKSMEPVASTSSTVLTRSCHSPAIKKEITCFFCDEPAGPSGLHDASTYDIDHRVRKCALELEDKALLAKLAPGDMIALEAKYHSKCLVKLYNKAERSTGSSGTTDNPNGNVHGIAFAKLVAYMEEFRSEECVAPVFKLADLANMYKARLIQLGLDEQERVHSTRLKNRLLSVFPDLKAHSQSKGILLTFDEDIASALIKACDHDSDALYLSKAAQVVRKDMFKTKLHFNGTFAPGCQEDSVPRTLLALVNMIQNGPNIKHQTEKATTTAALSISQLLIFNSVKHTKTLNTFGTVRHSSDRETPLPLYMAMKIHAVTRSRSLIDAFYNLGMCISYNRLLQITNDITNGVCKHFTLDDVVCPPKMRHGVFTTAAVNNIDYNPTSTTAKGSFHGTGISIIQHPSHECAGTDRDVLVISNDDKSTCAASLPSKYTCVPPAALKSKEFNVPPAYGPVKPDNPLSIDQTLEPEKEWFATVLAGYQKVKLDKTDWVSWSAYHASIQKKVIPPAAINGLLPLFLDNAHSVAMIKHSMMVVKAATEHLNPGQVPVITADQPLYAIAKQIQWTWPMLAEDKFVVMFGGLHIEMAILRVIGDWLEGSGWTSAIVQADIATPGTADSFIKASHVTKTRHAHQVTAASLHILMTRAYEEFCSQPNNPDIPLTMNEWCVKRANESAQFSYWLQTLSLETLLLTYVRAVREGNFKQYIDSLSKVLPWMFALDHTHYARWLPVHVRDMMLLANTHESVFAEFNAGNFVVHKTTHKFSAMAIDQCHEQNNAMIKGSGGAVGITDNPVALRRWVIGGPEVSRILIEFEESRGESRSDETDQLHHEQYPGSQIGFMKDVKSLVQVIGEMGNPFLEEGKDLIVLDSRDIMDTSVVEDVQKALHIGQQQYEEFTKERLVDSSKSINSHLPKNKLALFSRKVAKSSSKPSSKISALKNDCSLFSRLYISCQIRDGNLDNFFSHENQAAPPSLSLDGKLRSCTKSDLLRCLNIHEISTTDTPDIDAVILDGAAVVQMLSPGTARTFKDYADRIFIPYILSQIHTCSRVDVVWDVYLPESLKSATREKRGKGLRRQVLPNTVIPKNWKDFLRVDDNKTELFGFLSKALSTIPTTEGKIVFTTDGSNVLCSNPEIDTQNLGPCTHEEADTRLLLHVQDAVMNGFQKPCVRTVDTDVVVIAIATFRKISPDELWIAFGTGSHFKYIPIHQIASNMDPKKCVALPVFHALSGCDTVSSFGGRGKKTAWDTWIGFPDATDAFEQLLMMQPEIPECTLSVLERFVVLLYDRTSGVAEVNEARKELFTQKSRTIENIPPTQAALKLHIKRAAYQANIWNQALVLAQVLPSPADWGWEKDVLDWQPLWSTLPEASQSCSELIHCGCKKGCTGRCKCVKAALQCTALCSCSGTC